jgi:hypothetical protein
MYVNFNDLPERKVLKINHNEKVFKQLQEN